MSDDEVIQSLPPGIMIRTIAESYTIPFFASSTIGTTTSITAVPVVVTIDLYGKSFHQVEADAHNENTTGRTPTGLALWPAGKLLSDFLACCQGNPSTVVELGCGLGLCGLVSQALMMEGLVVLTDCDEETLQYAKYNVEQNKALCYCETLDWCQPSHAQRVKERLLGTADGFDRVVASDVIYEMTDVWVPDLFVTAKSLMKTSGGLFFLGIRRRTTSLESLKIVSKQVGLDGGRFVSNFLLDLFDNRLEISDDDDTTADKQLEGNTDSVGDDGSRSLFWSAAVLVYWHANDELGKEMATQLCTKATENGHQLDNY